MPMVELRATATFRLGAKEAVQAIKATEPVPELTGKVTTVIDGGGTARIKSRIKSTSKHHSSKGAVFGEVVAVMARLSSWLTGEIAGKAW